MAEPTTTAGGISITALLIALLGPLAGQYTVIVMAALADTLGLTDAQLDVLFMQAAAL